MPGREFGFGVLDLRTPVKPTGAVLGFPAEAKSRIDYSPRKRFSRSTPCTSRAGSREAKHQRSQPFALGPEGGARRQAQPGLGDQALGEGQRIGSPSTAKKAYMPPAGVGHGDAGQRGEARQQRVAAGLQALRPAPARSVGLGQRGQAGALHEHRRAGGVELDQLAHARAASPAAATIQPRRQPVIRKLLEKLCTTTSRSSGSAMSRKLGAQRGGAGEEDRS